MSLQIRFYANISTALQKKRRKKTNQPTDEHEGS